MEMSQLTQSYYSLLIAHSGQSRGASLWWLSIMSAFSLSTSLGARTFQIPFINAIKESRYLSRTPSQPVYNNVVITATLFWWHHITSHNRKVFFSQFLCNFLVCHQCRFSCISFLERLTISEKGLKHLHWHSISHADVLQLLMHQTFFSFVLNVPDFCSYNTDTLQLKEEIE